MEKLARKIFQPNPLTNEILEGVCGNGGTNLSDFVNDAITSYFTPANEQLKKEVEFLFTRIMNREEIDDEELKTVLARCVEVLKDYPINDVKPLEQIFIHFTSKRGRVLRYDYIQIVDSLQDARLHRLNEVLKTVDEDFTLGMREFGERTRTVFAHWDELCAYSEIYTALATIIECENIYYPLDAFRTIDLIRWIDICIRKSTIEAIKTPYPTNISLTQRYFGIRHEVSVYHTDNGYCALSGDVEFEKMSPEIKEYYKHYMNNKMPWNEEATEADLESITALEQEGRMLFRRLTNKTGRR